MLAKLEDEAPHFMYTLMNLPLPPLTGRMRLPVVRTQSKARTEEMNKDPLQQFFDDYCVVKDSTRLRWGEFYDAFEKTVDADEKHKWSRTKVARLLPNRHPIYKSNGQKWVLNIAFKSPSEIDQ